MGRTLSASDAGLALDFGGHIGVLVQFASAGGRPHAHIFDGAAEPAELMALEMGHRHQGGRMNDFRSDIHLFTVFQIHRHRCLAFAQKPVGNNDGRIVHARVGKPVFDGGLDMGHRIGPGPHIQGVGICQKRLGTGGPDGLDDFPYKYRPDKGGVALFSEMELNGGVVVFA